MKKYILTTLICGLCGTLSAQNSGYFIDFNSDGELSANFNSWNDGGIGGGIVTWDANAGINGSGGLNVVVHEEGRNFYYNDTFNIANVAVGETITSTMDFLWSSTSATTQAVVTMGFTTENNQTSLSSQASGNALAASLLRNGTDTVTLRLRLRSGNHETLDFNQSELTEGGWYQLSFTLVKTEDVGEFDYAVDLFSIGVDGVSESAFKSISGQVTNTDVYGSESAYFGYDVRNRSGTGVSQIDNLGVSVIPEPSTYVLFAGVAGLFVAMMYNRRK